MTAVPGRPENSNKGEILHCNSSLSKFMGGGATVQPTVGCAAYALVLHGKAGIVGYTTEQVPVSWVQGALPETDTENTVLLCTGAHCLLGKVKRHLGELLPCEVTDQWK